MSTEPANCHPNQTYKLRKIRHVRVETELWVTACVKAETEGVTISELVRRLLAEYVGEGN